MICALADTHALIWYLYDDLRLSTRARRFFEKSVEAGDQIGFSAISLVEIVYLIERGRINPLTLGRLLATLESEKPMLVELPVDHTIALRLQEIARESIPDMPDRIIAATALALGMPIISRDKKIRLSGLKTIW